MHVRLWQMMCRKCLPHISFHLYLHFGFLFNTDWGIFLLFTSLHMLKKSPWHIYWEGIIMSGWWQNTFSSYSRDARQATASSPNLAFLFSPEVLIICASPWLCAALLHFKSGFAFRTHWVDQTSANRAQPSLHFSSASPIPPRMTLQCCLKSN